jgi:hypothetical protein
LQQSRISRILQLSRLFKISYYFSHKFNSKWQLFKNLHIIGNVLIKILFISCVHSKVALFIFLSNFFILTKHSFSSLLIYAAFLDQINYFYVNLFLKLNIYSCLNRFKYCENKKSYIIIKFSIIFCLLK